MKTAYAAASLVAFLAAPAMTSTAFAEPTAYEFDKSHSTIRASWMHLGLSEQSIHFTDYDGVLLLDFEEPDNSTVDITFTLPGGFWVGANQERFEGHLNSDDLFNTAEYPSARFVSTGFETEDGETGVMTGDLTLLGQTHPVSLDVTLNQKGPHPMSGDVVAGFSASGTLMRSQWGMGYAVPAVSDEITLDIDTELALIIDEDMVEDEMADGEPAEAEAAEAEATEAEATEEASAEDDSADAEPAEDDSADDEAAEDDSAEDEPADDGAQ